MKLHKNKRYKDVKKERKATFMKKVLLIMLVIIFSSTLVLGCSSQVTSQSMAKEIVTQYKNQFYNITDYNKADEIFSLQFEEAIRYVEGFEGYLTEDGYRRFGASGIWAVPIRASNEGKFYLKMTSIDFKIITEESNKIIMEYELNLQASYPDTNKTETLVETGEIALIKENDTWRINHDWFRVADLFRQELRMGQGATMSF